jgi:NAD(P)-dependent dehydrogenase (short-subunit alcohol dehydrogenase family)
MEISLKGRVALVTGAAGDIGNALARHIAQAGGAVIMWDVKDAAAAQPYVERVRAIGQPVVYNIVDIQNRTAVNAAINAIVEQFGALDIVCANAGVGETARFLEADLDNWNKHLNINLTGSFHVGQAAARQMVSLKTPGRIIFTSSWVGEIPWPEITAYAVSKAGLNMLMKQMARELAVYGIRVNCIAPGIVRAGMAGRLLETDEGYAKRVSRVIPLGEPGTPEELGQAVVFMASDQGAYMTGQVLVLDGGCSLFQFDKE